MVYYDKFTSLDRTFWKPNMTWADDNDFAQHPGQRWMYYSQEEVVILSNPDPVINHSILKLGMTQMDFGVYRCGVISTIKNYSPPITIEARIQFGGIGLWGAFWTYGTYGHGSEIDILEQTRDGCQNNYHYKHKPCLGKAKKKQEPKFVNLDESWHVHKLVWTKESLKFYVDGYCVRTATKGVSNLFPKHQIIIGNGIYQGVECELKPIYVDWIKITE